LKDQFLSEYVFLWISASQILIGFDGCRAVSTTSSL